MSIKYYAGQSIVDTPKKKDGTPEKVASRHGRHKEKVPSEKREKIAVVDGKLVIVQK
jgi:hypothetical protein